MALGENSIAHRTQRRQSVKQPRLRPGSDWADVGTALRDFASGPMAIALSLIDLLEASVSSIMPPLWSVSRFHQPLVGAQFHPFAVPILLDWCGEVSRRFDLSKNVANVFLVGDRGRLLLTKHGLPDKATLEKLLSAIDSGLGTSNRVTLDPAKQTPSSRAAR